MNRLKIAAALVITAALLSPNLHAVSAEIAKPQITFIELGSVNCIPCKAMVPVMKQVKEKFGDRVSVVFYDVWTPKGEPFGAKYGIRAIPTQIFLDQNGKEFFRHEGFFPYESIVKVFAQKGVR